MNTTTKKTADMPCEESPELSQHEPAGEQECVASHNEKQPQDNSEENPLQQEVETPQDLQQQLAVLQDQHLRLAAEFDNYKRRMAKQLQEQLQYAHEPLVRELLPCLDHLQQAIHAGKQALSETAEPSLRVLIDGIDMVQKKMVETLQRSGISCLQPVGQPFDPNCHEAVSEQQDEQHPPGTVLQQLQPGYMMHNRLIRPAKVVVAKAKAKEVS